MAQLGRWNRQSNSFLKKNPSKKAISTAICDHYIPKELVLNLDQTPLSYGSPGKYTFNIIGASTTHIKGIDEKRQITATFTGS